MLMNLIRKFKDVGMSGSITRWYDKNTRENRMGEMREYATEVARHIKNGDNVLEIAPGPGYMSIELAKMGNYNITGLDISPDMVRISRKNAEHEKVNINFIQGNVTSMKFEEGTFDFIFCSAAFKNFKEPLLALKEMCRVIKKGGVVLISDMRGDVSNQALKEEVNRIGKSGFERFMLPMVFKNLARSAYTKDEFIDMIKGTSFEKHKIQEIGIGFYIYLYK